MAKVAFVVLLIFVRILEAEISCGAVALCFGYLNGGADGPSPACCSGLKKLNAAAATTPDRQAACNCLKSTISGLSTNIAAGLPAKCGVNIPYKIRSHFSGAGEAAAAGTNPDLCKFWLIQCVVILNPLYCQLYEDRCTPA